MTQTRTIVMQPVVIAEGITCHCRRVDTRKGRRVTKPFYELVKTIDGQEIVTKVRTPTSAVLWMDQVREDAAAYAADLDMQDKARRVVKAVRKVRRRAVRVVHTVVEFLTHHIGQPVQLAFAF